MNKKLFHVCNFFYIKVLTYLLHLICIRVRFFVLQELMKYTQLKPILSEYDYKEFCARFPPRSQILAKLL